MVLPSLLFRANRKQAILIRLTRLKVRLTEFSFYRRSAQSAICIFQCPVQTTGNMGSQVPLTEMPWFDLNGWCIWVWWWKVCYNQSVPLGELYNNLWLVMGKKSANHELPALLCSFWNLKQQRFQMAANYSGTARICKLVREITAFGKENAL